MPLHILRPDTNFDFVGFRRIAYVITALLILAGLTSLTLKGGPKYGIDFEGGVVVQLKFDQHVDTHALTTSLEHAQLPGLVVQRLGTEADNSFLVRSSASEVASETVRDRINQAFAKDFPDRKWEVQRIEIVGPKVGADLRANALEALLYAVLIIAIYISGRFEHRWMAAAVMAGGLAGGLWLIKLIPIMASSTGFLIIAALAITIGLCWYLRLSFAMGAIVALVHDAAVTIGLFSILNKEVDLTVIAAVLTLLGYSMNDTIIVFDRIREVKKNKPNLSLAKTINLSINQTLSRTILTSGLTFLVVLSLYLFGGAVIHDFAFALLVGIIVGTYSSIFIASPILLMLEPRLVDESTPVKA